MKTVHLFFFVLQTIWREYLDLATWNRFQGVIWMKVCVGQVRKWSYTEKYKGGRYTQNDDGNSENNIENFNNDIRSVTVHTCVCECVSVPIQYIWLLSQPWWTILLFFIILLYSILSVPAGMSYASYSTFKKCVALFRTCSWNYHKVGCLSQEVSVWC